MGRPPRSHAKSGRYYIALGGAQRLVLFSDEGDYQHFTLLIRKSLEQYQAVLLAFCWLEREALLAVQVPGDGLSRLMQHIASKHARYVNRKLARKGRVFRSRYFSIGLETPAELTKAVQFIHWAPVRSKMVLVPTAYRWSSHAIYMSYSKALPVATRSVLRASGVYKPTEFCSNIEQRTHLDGTDEHILPKLQRKPPARLNHALIRHIVRLVADYFGLEVREIYARSLDYRASLARAVACWYIIQSRSATFRSAAPLFNRSPAAIALGIMRCKQRNAELFRPTMISLEDKALPMASTAGRPRRSRTRTAVSDSAKSAW